MTRTNKFLFTWAALATVIAILLFHFRSCNNCRLSGGYTESKTVKELIDTMKFKVDIDPFQPSVFSHIEPSDSFIATLPVKDSSYCDSLARQFYTNITYLDTVKGDSIDLILKMSVSQNKVDSVDPDIIVHTPYIKTIETTIITPTPLNPWKLYIKANLGGGQNGFIGGGELLLTEGDNKKRQGRFCYSLSAHFTTFSEPVFMGGFGVKISFKQK